MDEADASRKAVPTIRALKDSQTRGAGRKALIARNRLNASLESELDLVADRSVVVGATTGWARVKDPRNYRSRQAAVELLHRDFPITSLNV
jgi:hypothetical protein